MKPIALLSYLEPLRSYLEMTGVSEVCINRPEEIWVEQHGRFERHDIPVLSLSYLWQLARLVAEYNQREISPETPSLSATLPNGARVQFVVEPACERGSFICSIRQPSVVQVPLNDYFKDDQTTTDMACSESESSLMAAYLEKDYPCFLEMAVLARKNIIISGGTSTGKTTFLNALLKHIPIKERIITIETDREVKVEHPNAVHLLAAEEGKSVADISMLGLLKASLRLRPDRILVSELRAEEAFPYLRAVNSGHPGSITTLHANSPAGCFDQLAFMVIQGGSHLSRQELIHYIQSIIDVVVQIKRSENGQRYVSEIYFKDAKESASLVQPIHERKQIVN